MTGCSCRKHPGLHKWVSLIPTKQSTTVRVDADVLAWLKGQGKGYQTRINAILREAMLRSLQHKA